MPAIQFHPQPDENGSPVPVFTPTPATSAETWLEPTLSATCSVTERPVLPRSLNGIDFTEEHLGEDDWKHLMKQYRRWKDAPTPVIAKRRTSGLVIVEPDGRYWIVHPTNQFGGASATFPKGRLEPGLSLLVNGVKEAWEESGILAEPLEYLCDVDRTKTVTRYYIARRLAGSPAFAGWESQAVSLVPAWELLKFFNRPNDQKILPYLAAWQLRHRSAA
ncbi:NUDIX hydrolase [Sutterella sp.]|uniref:NUDIX hydrolase n=1 Tax=Sutterella sp. TaxID=1981025 RepID=UPI0026DFAAA9|nr:NUDIX domain-containing protein [Sutterella sp.]MDO5531334.1 NUDIX domain-containing protein [Sutterella sp.]